MPVINFDYSDLCSLIGEEVPRDRLLERIPMIGADMHDTEGEVEEMSVEFFPDRPDLYSVEGLARAMRAFLDIEPGMMEYETEDTDIDVVAEVSQDRISYTVVAECKFTAKPMGFGALNRLRGRIGKRCDGRNLRIMLMSVSGFDDDLRDYAEEQGIILIDLDVLVGNSPAPRLRSGPDPAI